MPIRINLLAEAQAADELRRKDPVKRAILLGVSAVALVMFWSSFLQVQIYVNRNQLGTIEAQWKSIEAPYNEVVASRRKAEDIGERLAALQKFTTNRFLWGNVLNEFQKTMGGVEHIRTVRLKGEQTYGIIEEVKAKTDAGGPASFCRPTATTEKIVLKIDARDYSPEQNSHVKFRSAIVHAPYFTNALSSSNGVTLTFLSPPQVDPTDDRAPFVSFSLQCTYPEKIRR